MSLHLSDRQSDRFPVGVCIAYSLLYYRTCTRGFEISGVKLYCNSDPELKLVDVDNV